MPKEIWYVCWHTRNGGHASVFGDKGETKEEVEAQARAMGWTPARFWQWWRFLDRREVRLLDF